MLTATLRRCKAIVGSEAVQLEPKTRSRAFATIISPSASSRTPALSPSCLCCDYAGTQVDSATADAARLQASGRLLRHPSSWPRSMGLKQALSLSVKLPCICARTSGDVGVVVYCFCFGRWSCTFFAL